jgi:hypothetical protein
MSFDLTFRMRDLLRGVFRFPHRSIISLYDWNLDIQQVQPAAISPQVRPGITPLWTSSWRVVSYPEVREFPITALKRRHRKVSAAAATRSSTAWFGSLLWGGPPGPRGTPWSRWRESLLDTTRPTRASAADQGVRPTMEINHTVTDLVLLCYKYKLLYRLHPVML